MSELGDAFPKDPCGKRLVGERLAFLARDVVYQQFAPDQAASLAYFPADGNLARSDFSGSHLLYKCAKSASFQRSAGEQ